MARIKTKFIGVYYRNCTTNNKPDKTYYIRYKDNFGKTQEVKIGKYSEGVRENYCNLKRNEILTKLRLGEEPPAATKWKKKDRVKLDDLAKEYFLTRKDGTSKQSDIRTYNKHLSGYFENMEIITRKDINKFIKILKAKDNGRGDTLSDKTINNILTILSAIVKFALKEELIKNDITPFIKKFKIDNTRERFLSKSEIKRLYDRLQEEDDNQIFVFVKIALNTGARAGTIINIKKKDIDFVHGFITLKDYKNNTTYKAFLTDSLKDILSEYTKSIKNDENIFKYTKDGISGKISKILNELFNKGLNKNDSKNRVVVHTLRHTFASHLAIAGTPIYTIQKLMNHKDIKMTLRYAKLAPDSGKESVEKLGF